jgi:hypothetical protein
MLLFHGVYGRMYSLFLFTSALSFLALLHAIERRTGAAAPMSRHLIFILPFFALAIAEGLIRVASVGRRAAPIIAIAAALALLPAEVAWGWHRTPELYRGEPGAHVNARDAAAAWLAARSQPDDVPFGYELLYAQAWDDGGKVSKLVVPRADPKLALAALQGASKPLGHGVWVFDASDATNGRPHADDPAGLAAAGLGVRDRGVRPVPRRPDGGAGRLHETTT